MTIVLDYEIRALYSRFSQLDKVVSEEGLEMVRVASVLTLPEFKWNPLRRRIMQVLKLPVAVTFDELLKALQVFSINYPKEEKVKCKYNTFTHILVAFSIYDYDGDGFVARADVEQFLTSVLEIAISENEITLDELKQVVDNLFLELSGAKDSFITYEEFKKVVMFEDSVFQKFTIEYFTLGTFGV